MFRELFPEIFQSFDKVIIFQDIGAPNRTRFPVSRALQRHHQLLQEVEGFDQVLCTAFCGAPYFLLRAFPEKVELFAYTMMGKTIPTGKVFNEFEITQLELEEGVVRNYRDRLRFKNENMRVYLDHHFGEASVAPAIAPDAKFPETLADSPFIYQASGRGKPYHGQTINDLEYVDWARNGMRPASLADADLSGWIFVDQGGDYLNLGGRLLASGEIGGSLLALDQKRPVAPAYDGQMLGYNDQSWFRQVRSLKKASVVRRYPGFGDPAPFIEAHGAAPNKAPRVTVVIVHFNRPGFLKEVLRGFAEQTDRDFDIIIIDNNSARGPELDGIEDLSIRLVWNMNTYPGYARNLGAELATGKYVLFFDDDNVPKPGLIAAMRAAAEAGGHDIVTCFRETFINTIEDQGDIIMSAPTLANSSLLRNYLGDVVFLMDRQAFLDLKFSDYYRVGREDFEIMFLAITRGLDVHVVPEALYFYRLGNNDKIGNRHITHKTGSQKGLDYGSFRKYRRALGSYTAAKVQQLIENYHVDGQSRVAGTNKTTTAEPVPEHQASNLRRSLRKVRVLRWMYYKWIKPAASR
ncbi:MAG: glycosyltransferase family 2 protein [Rhodobacteraceae bacterium]|nr:glycosyltransferase family 2 protein [Paracoccaceae bacterium]